jgi:hypothetical protein
MLGYLHIVASLLWVFLFPFPTSSSFNAFVVSSYISRPFYFYL